MNLFPINFTDISCCVRRCAIIFSGWSLAYKFRFVYKALLRTVNLIYLIILSTVPALRNLSCLLNSLIIRSLQI